MFEVRVYRTLMGKMISLKRKHLIAGGGGKSWVFIVKSHDCQDNLKYVL